MMYKKKLDPSKLPELKSIYDNDLEKSVFDKADFIDNSHKKQEQEEQEEKGEKVIGVVEDGDKEVGDKEDVANAVEEVEGGVEGVEEVEDVEGGVEGVEGVEGGVGVEGVEGGGGVDGCSSSCSSEKSITFNRIKKKVVRKYMLLKNKIKTSSVDYKLDLINDAINKINSRINLLEIKVNNLELDINKNKCELLEYDRITTMEMTSINDKLNNANIIILD